MARDPGSSPRVRGLLQFQAYSGLFIWIGEFTAEPEDRPQVVRKIQESTEIFVYDQPKKTRIYLPRIMVDESQIEDTVYLWKCFESYDAFREVHFSGAHARKFKSPWDDLLKESSGGGYRPLRW